MEKVTEQAVAAMLARLGWPPAFEAIPLHGGANNQVFRVDAGNKKAVLKIYFQHPKDTRNRLESEFSFISFAWENGVRLVPQPLALDAKQHCALYGYVEGRALEPGGVDRAAVSEAVAFFAALNRRKDSVEAKSLPLASEAYFSVADHVDGVERRVKALQAIEGGSALDREAEAFIEDELIPAWDEVRGGIEGFESRVEEAARVLSPSDFGFHNALRAGGGSIHFLDFEYAGWDDPAKTIGDFFCQPKVPVPKEFYDAFARGVAACAPDPERTLKRAEKLLPVYRLKWCCILLNEFLPVDQKRRHFSGAGEDPLERKARQLKKAREALSYGR